MINVFVYIECDIYVLLSFMYARYTLFNLTMDVYRTLVIFRPICTLQLQPLEARRPHMNGQRWLATLKPHVKTQHSNAGSSVHHEEKSVLNLVYLGSDYRKQSVHAYGNEIMDTWVRANEITMADCEM